MDKQPIFYDQIMYMLVTQRLQCNLHLLARPYCMVAKRWEHGEAPRPIPCLYGPLYDLRDGSVTSDGAKQHVVTPPARLPTYPDHLDGLVPRAR
jgi:hypothetical protein